jgi:hypothetical protein
MKSFILVLILISLPQAYSHCDGPITYRLNGRSGGAVHIFDLGGGKASPQPSQGDADVLASGYASRSLKDVLATQLEAARRHGHRNLRILSALFSVRGPDGEVEVYLVPKPLDPSLAAESFLSQRDDYGLVDISGIDLDLKMSSRGEILAATLNPSPYVSPAFGRGLTDRLVRTNGDSLLQATEALLAGMESQGSAPVSVARQNAVAPGASRFNPHQLK